MEEKYLAMFEILWASFMADCPEGTYLSFFAKKDSESLFMYGNGQDDKDVFKFDKLVRMQK